MSFVTTGFVSGPQNNFDEMGALQKSSSDVILGVIPGYCFFISCPRRSGHVFLPAAYMQPQHPLGITSEIENKISDES